MLKAMQSSSEMWKTTGGDEAFSFDPHTKVVKEAAARRGIDIESIDNKTFFLKYGGKSILFLHHMPETTSAVARHISNDKHATKVFLDRAGVNTPRGRVLLSKEVDKGLAYARLIGYPVVIKPIAGTGGNGVTSEIQDATHFKAAWKVAQSLSTRVIVERHIYGHDYRLFVVNGRLICAAQRIPVNVTGDGESSITQLIDKKNVARASNPYVGLKKVVLTEEMLRRLKVLGYEAASVIPKGENVQLLPVANIGTGGDSKDVTDMVHPGFADIAVKAAHAIPGCFFAGVDLLVPDITVSPDQQDYAICEINTRADISMHHFPVIGERRDAAGALVEALFPGASVVVESAMKKIMLTLRGNVIGVGMRKHIQKLASLNCLYGWVKNEGEEVKAVLCGSQSAVDRVILSLAGRPSTFTAFENWLGEAPGDFKIIK